MAFDILHGEQLDGRYHVTLSGQIDIVAAEGGQAVVEGLRRSGCADVVVCLAGVRVLEAAGTGFVVELVRISRDRGGRVLVRGPRPLVLRALALTRLRQVRRSLRRLGTAGVL